MKRIYIALLAGCIFMTTASAQKLTNGDYKEKVLKYSNQIKSAQQNMDAASFGTKAAKTNYLPNVSGSGAYNYQFNPAPLSLGGTSIDMKKSWIRCTSRRNSKHLFRGRSSESSESSRDTRRNCCSCKKSNS